jgi:16S rRNA (uracil1498-N3)-methyltransferase
MPRFYFPDALTEGAVVALPDHVAHHLHVLRLVPGDRIILFNGQGGEYHATLENLDRRRAQVEIKLFRRRKWNCRTR